MAKFEKGKSGNPGGRSPRVTEEGFTLTQLARKNTAEALEVLREIYLSKTTEAKDRIAAANIMLVRGWGAPKPAAEEGGEGDEPQPVRVEVSVTDARKPHAESQ